MPSTLNPKPHSLHIGIDGNEANVGKRVGSNQYAFGILWGMYQLHPENTQFTIYLKAAPLTDLPPAANWWHYRIIRPGFAWTQWRLPLDLFCSLHRPDVFFSPGHYAPRIAPMPTVVSIMDLAFLKMPQLFLKFKRGAKQLADWTAYSVKQACAIIAISQHTAKDIADIYTIDQDKITVAYPGVDRQRFKMMRDKEKKSVIHKYKLPEKYILHLGTLQPRKNIIRLIAAFESLPPKYKAWHLVLAGQSGWLTEEIDNAIKSSKVADRIIRTGYVDEADIPALISAAGCLVLVGLYEGFGMPPAESLACGTIPVVSNNTSLPEVVGEAGIIVDPYSIASIAHGIMVTLDLKITQKQQRLAIGQTQLEQFEWQRSAQRILNVLRKVGA